MFSCKLKLGASEEIFLKAFILQAFSGKFEELPKDKNPVYQGLSAAQKIILQSKPNLDMTLFKQNHGKMPIAYILGDVYGKEYPIEKKILDKLIHLLRTNEYAFNLQSCFVPWDEIAKEKGLKVNITSELIKEEERVFLQDLLNEHKVSAESLNFKDIKTYDQCLMFQKSIQSIQKNLKGIKQCVDTMVSERITACFAPYQGAARAKAKKIKITVLRDAAMMDKDSFHHFNPSMVLLAVGQPRLMDTIPKSWSSDQCKVYEQKVNTIFSGLTGVTQQSAEAVLRCYFTWLR